MDEEYEVNQLPEDIPYERWVEHVFDHPVLPKNWWWHLSGPHAESWDDGADAGRTLSYLTRLFKESGELDQRYSRAQIDQGLNYLVSSSCSNHMFAILDEGLPLGDRLACIEAIGDLYEDLLARVYGDDIAHGSGSKDVNFALYMWWDIAPLYGAMQVENLADYNRTILSLFERILKLKSEACVESALHGLGHWHHYCSKEVERVVGEFLKERKDLSTRLRSYAKAARKGRVQ